MNETNEANEETEESEAIEANTFRPLSRSIVFSKINTSPSNWVSSPRRRILALHRREGDHITPQFTDGDRDRTFLNPLDLVEPCPCEKVRLVLSCRIPGSGSVTLIHELDDGIGNLT